jgi:hypothetical protein
MAAPWARGFAARLGRGPWAFGVLNSIFLTMGFIAEPGIFSPNTTINCDIARRTLFHILSDNDMVHTMMKGYRQ